jgi:hypothetical protein
MTVSVDSPMVFSFPLSHHNAKAAASGLRAEALRLRRRNVNMRNTRSEYFTSDVHSIRDIARTSRDVREVP